MNTVVGSISVAKDKQVYIYYSNDGVSIDGKSETWGNNIDIDIQYRYFRIQVKNIDGSDINPNESVISDIAIFFQFKKLYTALEAVQNNIQNNFLQGSVSKFNGNPNGIENVIITPILHYNNIIAKTTNDYVVNVIYSNDGINTEYTGNWNNFQKIGNSYKYIRILMKKMDESKITVDAGINLLISGVDNDNNTKLDKINTQILKQEQDIDDIKKSLIYKTEEEKIQDFNGFDSKEGIVETSTRIGVVVPYEYKDYNFLVRYECSSNDITGNLYIQQKGVGNISSPKKLELIANEGIYTFESIISLEKEPTGEFLIFVQASSDSAPELSIKSIKAISEYDIKAKIDKIEKDVDELKTVNENGKIIITVKKDGSGDFLNIQDAINSIIDASENKRYEVDFYDDWLVEDISELYKLQSPNVHSDINPNEMCAFVITKNYVDVVGKGYGKRKIVVKSPIDIAGYSLQYIQTVYLKGNCTIANFDVEIYGGRYAIHQESGGSKSSEDYHATTVMKNIIAIHHGNDLYVNGSSWESCCAQANGTTSGLRLLYYNCKWMSPFKTPFYCHTNGNFDAPNLFFFEGCEIIHMIKCNVADDGCGIRDLGSGQLHKIVLRGCRFPNFTTEYLNAGNLKDRSFKEVLGYMTLNGYGNSVMLNNVLSPNCLIIRSKNINEQLSVTGGNAVQDILGNYKLYNADNSNKSLLIGDIMIYGTGAYSLHSILGDCSINNKTLNLECGENSVSIQFNKDYTVMSDDSIISELNSTYTSVKFSLGINEKYVSKSDAVKIVGCDDCIEICENYGDIALLPFQCVIRDLKSGLNCWRLANANEKVEGIVAERIDVGGNGKIILADRMIFGKQYVINTGGTYGDYVGVGTDSYPKRVENKEDATWKMIDDIYFHKV